MGKPKKAKSTTESTTSGPAYQQAALADLVSKATAQSNNGGFYDSEYFKGQDSVAGFNSQQTSALDSLFNAGGVNQGVYDTAGVSALSETLGAFDPNNLSLQNAIGSNADSMYEAFSRNVMPGIQGNAMNLGATGSKRHGVAQGLALSDLNKDIGKMSTDMTYNAYQSHEQDKMNALMNLGQINSGLTSGLGTQLEAGTMYQGQEQKDLDAAMQAWAYENDVNYNNLAALRSLVMGDMGATTNSKTTGSGGGSGGTPSLLANMLGSMMGGS